MIKPRVSLVIPGRNAASTLGECLAAACPMLERGELLEILFVDDGSTDDTRAIAAQFPVKIIAGAGEGPGAARNRGIAQAKGEWIWFIDSDCVADPDALTILLPYTQDKQVAAVGGSYGNMRPDSLLACLIHEEIIARHERMSSEVNFIGTFNALYRKDVLQEVGGFDEHFLKAQDAELAYRVRSHGYKLNFDGRSRVKHFHPDRLRSYLATQKGQGYWRIFLYKKYPQRMRGDSYSGLSDYVQPPLALLIPALIPLSLILPMAIMPLLVSVVLLLACQMPMALKIEPRLGVIRTTAFIFMSSVRAFARAIGMLQGALDAHIKQHKTGTR